MYIIIPDAYKVFYWSNLKLNACKVSRSNWVPTTNNIRNINLQQLSNYADFVLLLLVWFSFFLIIIGRRTVTLPKLSFYRCKRPQYFVLFNALVVYHKFGLLCLFYSLLGGSSRTINRGQKNKSRASGHRVNSSPKRR